MTARPLLFSAPINPARSRWGGKGRKSGMMKSKSVTPANPFESEDYQRFVESMVPYCHCKADNCPCDGVLAGGLCDGITDDERDTIFDDYEDNLP